MPPANAPYGPAASSGVASSAKIHGTSRKYFALYVAELQFRYKNRRNAEILGAAIGNV
jgi:hypothetical protein